MTKTDRDKWLREIAAELKRIRDIPIRELPEGAVYNFTMARNMLRAIKYRTTSPPRSGD